jgi:hypothetical protein
MFSQGPGTTSIFSFSLSSSLPLSLYLYIIIFPKTMDWASLSPTHYGTPLIGQTLDLFQIIPNSFGRGGGGAGEAALGV